MSNKIDSLRAKIKKARKARSSEISTLQAQLEEEMKKEVAKREKDKSTKKNS